MKSREIVKGEREREELRVSYEKQPLIHLHHGKVGWLWFWRKRLTLNPPESVLESVNLSSTAGAIRSSGRRFTFDQLGRVGRFCRLFGQP